MNYEYLEKDNLLFQTGENPDRVYILLNGSIDHLIPKLEECNISFHEYMIFLGKLKFNNENIL